MFKLGLNALLVLSILGAVFITIQFTWKVIVLLQLLFGAA